MVNGAHNQVDVLDHTDTFQRGLEFGGFGPPDSVAVNNGVVAVAVASAVKTNPGKVFFFDTAGNAPGEVGVGALPDMATFIPKALSWTCNYGLLVANEVGGTTSYYDISLAQVPVPAPLALLALGVPFLLPRPRA